MQQVNSLKKHIVFKNIESLFSHTYFPEIIDGNQIVVNIGIFD